MILHDILSVCIKGESITQIVYKSNINFPIARRFLEPMLKNNLLEKINDSPVIYKTTPKGEDILKRLKIHLDQMNGVFGD